jgi:hypothetical protein
MTTRRTRAELHDFRHNSDGFVVPDEVSARVQRRNGELERKEQRISKHETVLSNSVCGTGRSSLPNDLDAHPRTDARARSSEVKATADLLPAESSVPRRNVPAGSSTMFWEFSRLAAT